MALPIIHCLTTFVFLCEEIVWKLVFNISSCTNLSLFIYMMMSLFFLENHKINITIKLFILVCVIAREMDKLLHEWQEKHFS